MNTTLATTATTALDQLNRSLAKGSLGDLVQARTKRTLLLVDVSGSMAHMIVKTGKRRIDALRGVVADLRSTHNVPVAAFGLRGRQPVDLLEGGHIPEPQGSTPLDRGIAYGTEQGANHLVVVTDGEPNSPEAAYEAARHFGGPIDVFFVGDATDYGRHFASELARRTGGKFHFNDLTGAPKELAGEIRLLLGDGGAL